MVVCGFLRDDARLSVYVVKIRRRRGIGLTDKRASGAQDKVNEALKRYRNQRRKKNAKTIMIYFLISQRYVVEVNGCVWSESSDVLSSKDRRDAFFELLKRKWLCQNMHVRWQTGFSGK